MDKGDFFDDDPPAAAPLAARPRTARGKRMTTFVTSDGNGGGRPLISLRPHTPFVPESYGPDAYKAPQSKWGRSGVIGPASGRGKTPVMEEQSTVTSRRWSADSIGEARDNVLSRNQRETVLPRRNASPSDDQRALRWCKTDISFLMGSEEAEGSAGKPLPRPFVQLPPRPPNLRAATFGLKPPLPPIASKLPRRLDTTDSHHRL